MVFTDNILSHNGVDGFHFGPDLHGALTNNALDRNGDDGVEVEEPVSELGPVTLTGNHVWFNGDLGIEASRPDTLGGGNWAKHNGNSLQCVPGSLCSTTGKPKK